jgi:hypothetical protein
MTESNISLRLHAAAEDRPPSLSPRSHYASPEDVLLDPALSVAEKRNILASWASDAHAVADKPALRQLESGAVVGVQDVLAALQELDGLAHLNIGRPSARQTSHRRHSARVLRWLPPDLRGRHPDNDDDDPPPCPAVIAPIPFLPSSGAEAELEAA